MNTTTANPLSSEVARRRTFAIISHPDAGKTTLTEKLLLYGRAIHSAGAVKARTGQKTATSDWMELEKQRGISVTSTVLQFPYQGFVINLLDTPGHNDFSADTYRTLTAADSVVMLVDYAKGVEAQTRKLFSVCRDRGIPIFTFVNKMDHDGLGPLAVMEDIEKALGLHSVPMNWPIGDGVDFRGVYDRTNREIHIYQRSARGATRAEEIIVGIDDPQTPKLLGEAHHKQLLEDIDLLNVAAEPFDDKRVRSGELTPMFFGSALTNFGVELFLKQFIHLAPNPGPRHSTEGSVIQPSDGFSAFVFKIQANMNPEHRDRIAFLRIVSGEFNKDMEVTHVQSGKTLKISRPQRVFAQERETIEKAYAGDIFGIPNPGFLRLGDTLIESGKANFDEVPHFTPEIFATIENRDAARYKHFEKGVTQLVQEGLVDLFSNPKSTYKQYFLGAVGQLQFDVVKFRLANEYGVNADITMMPHNLIAWVGGDVSALDSIFLSGDLKRLEDSSGNTVIISSSEFQLKHLGQKLPGVTLLRGPNGKPLAL